MSIEAGVKGTFVPSLVGNLLDKHHDCVVCLDGSLSIFVSGTATLKIKIIAKSTTVNWDAIDLSASVNMGKFYFSIGPNGMKLGFGTCPYISHKVTVTVYSGSGNPVLGAVVSTTTGYCDADGDEKFKETSMRTDEKGQAVFYFARGQHEIVAEKDGLGTGGQKFEMLAIEKEINLELFDAEYFNGHWYKAYDISKSWTDAKSYCESLGGHLVTITSNEENNFVYSTIKNKGKNVYWLGGYLNNNSWCWITGEPFYFTNWGINKPDNTGGKEYYLHMYRISINSNPVSSWNDEDNTGDRNNEYALRNIGFVCEWETIPSSNQVKSYRMTSRNIVEEPTNETIINGTTATRFDALKGAEYVAVAIKDELVEDIFADDNLIYIDQKTADDSTIPFDVVIPEGVDSYIIKIFGVSHTHTPAEATIENENKATCTAPGSYDAVTYCSVCDEELIREVVTIPNNGHSGGTANCKDKAICDTCGEAYGELDKNKHKSIVTDKAVAATCTAIGLTEGSHCDACGEIIEKQIATDKLAHNMSEFIVVTKPGCTNAGAEKSTCSACGYSESKSVPATDHNYENGVCENCGDSKAANCSHMCHKKGFMGFIWKLLRFFFKLFKIQPVCDCGVKHY